MTFTIADVLELPGLRAAAPEVVAVAGRLDRPVRWVHSTEMDDLTSVLRGGELVLTVGIGLGQSPAEQDAYLQRLLEAGAVGLVIYLRERWPHGLPAEFVANCEARDVPLVVLHRMCRFAEVIREFAEQVIDSQILELRSIEIVHGTFNRLAVEGASPQEVLAEVTRLSGCPVVLESMVGELMAYNAGDVNVTDLLAEWAEQPPPPTSHRTSFDAERGWLTTYVGARGQDWARLRLRLSLSAPERRTMVLLQQAATTLALFRLESRAQGSLALAAHDPVIQKLREGDIDSGLVETMRALGMSAERFPFTAWCLRPDLIAQPEGPAGATRLHDLAYIFERTCRSAGTPCLVATHQQAVIAITCSPEGPDRDVTDVEAHVERLAALVNREQRIVAGASAPCMTYEGLPSAITEAAAALRAAPQEAGTGRVYRLPDLHIRGLLTQLADDERVREFWRRELRVLADYDAKHRGQLVETLMALLSTTSKAAAAERAHLSRAALYDRLARIQELTGLDLDDAETRTSLHVALLLSEGAASLGGRAGRGGRRKGRMS